MLQFSFNSQSAGFILSVSHTSMKKTATLFYFLRGKEMLSMMSSTILKAFCISYFQHDVERDWGDFLYISDQEG